MAGRVGRGVLAPYTIVLDRFAGDSAGLASLRAAPKSLGVLSREGIHRRQEHATGPRARPSMFAQMAGSLEGDPTPPPPTARKLRQGGGRGYGRHHLAKTIATGVVSWHQSHVAGS